MTERMPIICTHCFQVFPFELYSIHRVPLPEADYGFICLTPEAAAELAAERTTP
jgi:hypothetical protein